MPIPCDYEITEAEKDAVLAGTISMLQVLTDNPREIPWSEKEFMRRGFTDYFREECHFSEEQIEESLDKLDKNSSLRIKLYFSIMDEMSTVDEYMRQLKG